LESIYICKNNQFCTKKDITTSGQSNLTKGRIATAHESFNHLQPENTSFKRFQH